jgi:hypothetical protein
MKILDLSAGNRAAWFNKNHPDAVYVDIRPEVEPMIVADSRALPGEVGTDYDLVIFDRPHKNNAASFGMARSYGHFTAEEIRDIIKRTAAEAHRVTRHGALMAFKWNDHSRKLTDALGMLQPYWEPLICHGIHRQQRHGSSTSWSLLQRTAPPLRMREE